MKIGILQCDHVPVPLLGRHGDHEEHFRRFLAHDELEFQTYSILDEVLPLSIADADGWLITGSRYSVHDDFLWLERLKQFVREVYELRRPLIGVCFGHQLIADALGGSIGRLSGGRAAGPRLIKRSDDTCQIALFYHQEEVITAPAVARVLGSAEHCANVILRYGDTVLTYQAHPEFRPDFLVELIQHVEGNAGELSKLMAQAVADFRSDDECALANEMKNHFLRHSRIGDCAAQSS